MEKMEKIVMKIRALTDAQVAVLVYKHKQLDEARTSAATAVMEDLVDGVEDIKVTEKTPKQGTKRKLDDPKAREQARLRQIEIDRDVFFGILHAELARMETNNGRVQDCIGQLNHDDTETTMKNFASKLAAISHAKDANDKIALILSFREGEVCWALKQQYPEIVTQTFWFDNGRCPKHIRKLVRFYLLAKRAPILLCLNISFTKYTKFHDAIWSKINNDSSFREKIEMASVPIRIGFLEHRMPALEPDETVVQYIDPEEEDNNNNYGDDNTDDDDPTPQRRDNVSYENNNRPNKKPNSSNNNNNTNNNTNKKTNNSRVTRNNKKTNNKNVRTKNTAVFESAIFGGIVSESDSIDRRIDACPNQDDYTPYEEPTAHDAMME